MFQPAIGCIECEKEAHETLSPKTGPAGSHPRPAQSDRPRGSGAPEACAKRTNNTIAKLLECVELEGVREHQAVFQEIADANGDTRASGTSGYDESADYVAERLDAAGMT
ncbi:MAG TPA: hypothetical protein VFV13_08875 [Acidimicrobiia bacterium]|nr:hypothetical protein [Acidimicrobiia bacterium]